MGNENETAHNSLLKKNIIPILFHFSASYYTFLRYNVNIFGGREVNYMNGIFFFEDK